MAKWAQTTDEQRRSLYADVEELLSPGFLSERVVVGGVSLSLRNLLPSDQFLLRHRIGTDFDSKEAHTQILAQSIWMLDGQVLLEDSRSFPKVRDLCCRFPQILREDLFQRLIRLQGRVNAAIGRSRSYFYEEDSRYLWRAYKVSVVSRFGVPGADRLGPNSVLEMWRVYNHTEDEREEWQSSWSQTKMIVATQAPKGVEKLNSADEAAWSLEQARRQSVMDAMYYESKGYNIDSARLLRAVHSEFDNYDEIKMAVTPEELENEMRKVRMGIKDGHDEVIERHKSKIAERVEREKAEQRDRILAAQMAADAAGEAPLQLIPMSREEFEDRFQAKPQGKKVYYQSQANPLYERFIKSQAVAGRYHGVDEAGRPIVVPDRNLQGNVQTRKGGKVDA